MTRVMTKVSKKLAGGGLLAAVGLSALSPLQQGALTLSVAGAAMWTAPALASGKIRGKVVTSGDKGTVIRKQRHAERIIIAPTDPEGVVQVSGLEPGKYEVNLIGDGARILISVGAEGRMAFVAKSETTYPEPKATDPRARRALPVVQYWVEPIAFGEQGGSGTIIAIVAARVVDLNTANAAEIARVTGTSIQSAVHIVVQREKGGLYSSIENFAQRNCRTMDIDMNRGGIKVSDLTIMMPVAGAVSSGLQCRPGGGQEFSLYGQKHNYVGHVTLLR